MASSFSLAPWAHAPGLIVRRSGSARFDASTRRQLRGGTGFPMVGLFDMRFACPWSTQIDRCDRVSLRLAKRSDAFNPARGQWFHDR
jgi:hypothetical protein